MAKAPFQGYFTDVAGNVLEWPFTITVRREVSGLPIARIYSDRDGATPLSNPFTVTAADGWEEGFARFFASGGAYHITATKDSVSTEPLRYHGIGTYQEADQGALNDPGYLFEFESETVAPPTEGFFRINNANPQLATQMFVSKTTRGGFDVGQRLLDLDPGTSTKKNTLIAAGVDLGGATWLVDAAGDSAGVDDFVTIDLSSPTGSTTFELDLFSLQREMVGDLGPTVDPLDLLTVAGAFTFDPLVHSLKMVRHNNASAADITLPNDAVEGEAFQVMQIGAGRSHFVAASGATLRSDLNHAHSLKQWSVCGAIVESNVGGSAAVWVLFGSTGQ